MNKSETSKILSSLSREYRGEVIDPERTELWHEVLGKLDYKQVRSAVVKWLSDPELSRWFPKPAQLKSLCEDNRTARLEEDPAIVERYFALIDQSQTGQLNESEERELSRIEGELGLSKVARSFVDFKSPRIEKLRLVRS